MATLWDTLHSMVANIPWKDEAQVLEAHAAIRQAALDADGKVSENAPAPIDVTAAQQITAPAPPQDVQSLIEQAVQRALEAQSSASSGKRTPAGGSA